MPPGVRLMRTLALCLLFPLLLLSRALAADLVPVPPLTGHVVDLTGSLSPQTAAGLDAELAAFEAQKGSQVAVLIVPTTQPEEIEQYSIRVAEAWKLGRKKVDDGVILLVAKQDRSMRLEVGYGLEGALSDLVSKRIISDIITPYFQQDDFEGGIRAGVEAVIKVVSGESLPAPAPQHNFGIRRGGNRFGTGLFIAAFILTGMLRSSLGRFRGGFLSGGVVGVLAWLILGSVFLGVASGVVALLFAMMGGNGRGGGFGGGYGGFGGGGFSGGGGGFSGGGFSGGGGGFGGGGASGKW